MEKYLTICSPMKSSCRPTIAFSSLQNSSVALQIACAALQVVIVVRQLPPASQQNVSVGLQN